MISKVIPVLLLLLTISAPSAMGQDLVFPGTDTKATGGRKSKNAPPVKIKAKKPALMFKSTIVKTNLVVSISDGKQKFGDPKSIQIKSGDNIYMRPRLLLAVPLDKAKGVLEGKPLLVVSFSHFGDEYDVKLVHSANSDLPDTVVTKKESTSQKETTKQ